jgi:PAS domain S-box-containing protein
MAPDDRPLVPFGEARPRALVVDDDATTRDVFTKVLSNAGIDVIVAGDGLSALEILKHNSVHLVVLDSHLPGLGGLEVIARLRAEQSTVHLPVILVTGDADIKDRVKGLELGADDYLTKPVSARELVARAHAQLRRRTPEDGIRRFVESANDAFVSWNSAGQLTEWTTQAEALFGWTRSEVLGTSFGPMILAPRHRVVHEQRMERFLRDGERPLLGKWFELTAMRRDAHEVAIEMTVWIVSDHDRHHTFNAFIRDLTKRGEIEDALRDTARLQTVVDGVRDVIILTDLVGVIVYSSPSARTVLGFEPDELYGRSLDEFVHVEDRGAFADILYNAVEDGLDVTTAQRILTHDGRYLWMEQTTAIVRDAASGKTTGLEIVSRDITRRRLADEALRRASGDLTRHNHDLRAAVVREHEAVEQLQELDRVRNDLVSTVSHELRTPLTSISGYIEMLVDPEVGPLSNVQRSMLEVVERNTKRLLVMIENLLTIGGIEAGAFDVEPVRLDIVPLIRIAIEAMQPSAHDQEIAIDVDVQSDTSFVLADAQQLDRVLLNLLSNAIKFTARGGHVTVSTRSVESEVEVVIADTGVGVPADEQAKLFTPFFRATDAIQRALPGTGLGLVIVKNIVDRHGGSIDLQSTPGEGTTVRFTLPAASDAMRLPA